MARNYGLQHSDYDELWQSRRRARSQRLHWLVIAAGLAIIAFNLWPR